MKNFINRNCESCKSYCKNNTYGFLLIDNLYQKQDEYFMFNPLARQYWSLVEGQTRLKNRYKQLIEIVFPEFNLLFNDLYSDLALNFIHDFPPWLQIDTLP